MSKEELDVSAKWSVCGRVVLQDPQDSQELSGDLQDASPASPVPKAQPARRYLNGKSFMPQTLNGVLRRNAVDSSAPTALEALAALEAQIMQPPVELSCENPECNNTCTWKRSKGRPQIFCSRVCKQRYESTRGRMQTEIAILEAILANPGRATAVQQNRLRGEIAHRRWVGRHYGISHDDAGR